MINTVKLTDNGYLINGSLSVPNAEGNRHYQAVQEWIAQGNTPEPADIIPEPTAQEQFDARLASDPILSAIVAEIESTQPNFRTNAKARLGA